MRGRKPIPAETRRREGNRGKREIGDPVLIGPRLTATEGIESLFGCRDNGVQIGDTLYPYELLPPVPDHLVTSDDLDESQDAQVLWYEVSALLIDGNLITAGDVLLLEGLVEACLIARAAFLDVRESGAVIETLNPSSGRASKKTSPSLNAWLKARQAVYKFAEQYGLTPVARARLGLAIGKGRKIAQELDTGLPDNPRSAANKDDTDVIDVESEG